MQTAALLCSPKLKTKSASLMAWPADVFLMVLGNNGAPQHSEIGIRCVRLWDHVTFVDYISSQKIVP